ncbi:SMC-Scp complex subunit ScpB [Catenulispora rubra]|uniref:SMC-Scp complex subunit ScpB n=1 Tax=Catenulispora rubra TaxID=280293 RepID=UPI00189240E5|nr:SMC-Scp complex subunit ScpB [Catenulispora rubra]
MSDDWEYESPEYVAADEGAEAEGATPVPREQTAEPAAAAAAKSSAASDLAAEATAALAADRPAAETSVVRDEPAVPSASAAGFPAPRSESTPLPSPRTEAEPSLADLDEATWQLSTDMAPLPPLRQCLEAILLVVEEPVADVVLAQITERPRDEVVQTLHELSAEYTEQQRGFDLRQVAGGWRLYTRAACAPLVEKFVLDGQQAKLSQPALETLAVVAYRQPVSRSRISAVRGVNCDGVMRTLLTRGLIEEAGTDADSGAILYRTTLLFLEKMGMRTLDELPELAPLLPSVESMEENESLA